MKKSEIAMIVLIASVCAFGTYLILRATPIGKSVDETVQVQTIDPIVSEVETPDTRIFNDNAINPSVEVQISDSPGASSESTFDDSSQSAE